MPQEPTVHYVFDDDAFTFHESALVDGVGDDGSEAIHMDRGGPDGRVASADLASEGVVTDRIEGRASHKDDAELRVATVLISRLNRLGASWHSPALMRSNAREERGVDCMALDGAGQQLLIQVTTTDPDAWPQLARVRRVERSVGRDTVILLLRDAIRRKASRADPEIVLALDATDSVRGAFRSVAAQFSRQYGQWAAGVGFKQIWLVGPGIDLVHRLDDARWAASNDLNAMSPALEPG